MISFTQSRCNNHKPGMAHVFATPGGQSFLHLEVLSTILLWRCRHLRIPQLDKNSTTPPSPTDPTIDSIEPRKIAERRFWIWMQSQLIFNYNGIYQPCSINDGGKATIAVERHGKMSQHAPAAMDCSVAPTPVLSVTKLEADRDETSLTTLRNAQLGRKMWGVVLIPKPAATTKDRAYTRGLTAARKRFKWIDVTRFNILVSKNAMIVYSALWFLACKYDMYSYFRSFSTLACATRHYSDASRLHWSIRTS